MSLPRSHALTSPFSPPLTSTISTTECPRQCELCRHHARAPLHRSPPKLTHSVTTISSSSSSSPLSHSSFGEAALLFLPPWFPRRSATIHVLMWPSSSGTSFLYLSSVARSSCSTSARAKPTWAATGRRWPAHYRAPPPSRHCHRQVPTSATATPSSLPTSAACHVDHVGADHLTGDFTAGEKSAVKIRPCLCYGC
jgi:hypothetical protein